MIIKAAEPESTRSTITGAELREALIELWAQIFERELRADLKAQTEVSGQAARLRAIARTPRMDDSRTREEW